MSLPFILGEAKIGFGVRIIGQGELAWDSCCEAVGTRGAFSSLMVSLALNIDIFSPTPPPGPARKSSPG